MKRIKLGHIILLGLFAFQVSAQRDSSHAPINCWLSFGPMISTLAPGSPSFYGTPTMPGAGACLNFEYKRVVCSLGAYGVTNGLYFNNDFLTDDKNEITSFSFQAGPRYSGKWGSFVPLIGISAGILTITTGS